MKKISFKNKIFCFFVFLVFSFVIVGLKANSSNQKIDNEIPEIISRSAWFTDDLKGLSDWMPQRDNFPPDYRKINKIIIHHSAGTNDIPNPTATIKGIYRYHAVSRGWNDIGYNYIIDREGRIYEGRMGGNGVRGAHVYARSDCLNFNYGSIGIVFLGNYVNEHPPEAMYESAAKLVGWLAEVNGLDPTKTAHHSLVWQDKKLASGTCDSSVGGFTYNYYDPVVVGHKDVGATACPGIIDLKRIRKEAGDYLNQLSITNYELSITNSSDKIYEIKNGYAEVVGEEELGSILPENIAQISESQLDLFLNKNYFRYSDGKLLKFSESEICLIENGALRKFDLQDTLKKLGFNIDEAIELPKSDKDLYLSGSIIKYAPDGKLFLSSGEVCYIENGKKRPFTSAPLFESLGYKWEKIEKAEQSVLDEYLSGDVMRYKEGTLLAVGPTVCVLENNSLCGITSAQLFETLGYKWNNIIPLSENEHELYLAGTIKRYPDNTLAIASGDATVFCLKENKRQGFCSAELFENLGFKWEDILEVSSDELALYSDGGEMKYSDGYVLRQVDSPAVYVIENGKKREFGSAEEFLNEGHKWDDVLVLNTNELDRYDVSNAHLADSGEESSSAETMEDKEEIGTSSRHPEEQSDEGSRNLAGLTNPKVEERQEDIEEIKKLRNPEIDEEKSEETVDQETEDKSSNPQVPSTMVTVALKTFNKSIGVTSISGKYEIKDNITNQIIYTGTADNIYTMNFGENSDVTISADQNVIKIYSIDNVIIDEKNPFHNGYGGATDNVFYGKINIKYSNVSSKLWVINELPLEDYVKGVAEISESAPKEYLKAMSIIIRTYVFYHVDNGGKHKGEPFDLKNSLNGNGDDQIYKGHGFSQRAPIFSSVVDETAGQIITYNNNPILAAYSSDSGGVSKDARQVWPSGFFNDKPYLYGGAKDPDSTEHNSHSVSISHGVGLCAAGAKEMARLGKTYEEIIKWYYMGVKLI